jgi:glycosyltransferase involved in cell wall biosynthesis
LVDGWFALALLDESVSLEIIGDGTERQSLRQRAVEREVHQCFSFFGVLSCPVVIERVRAAAVLIPPSWYESLPLELLEAMIVEVPIIATDVIGNRETVRNCSDQTDSSASGLASSIRRFQSLAPDAIAQMVTRGRRKAEWYRWSSDCDEYEAVYQRGS